MPYIINHCIPIDSLVREAWQYLSGLQKVNPEQFSWFRNDKATEELATNIAFYLFKAREMTRLYVSLWIPSTFEAITIAALTKSGYLKLQWVKENRIPTDAELKYLMFDNTEYSEAMNNCTDQIVDHLPLNIQDKLIKTLGIDPYEDWVKPRDSYKEELENLIVNDFPGTRIEAKAIAKVLHWTGQWDIFHIPEKGRAYRNGKNIYVLNEHKGIAVFPITRNGEEKYCYTELFNSPDYGWTIAGITEGRVTLSSIDNLTEDLDCRHMALETLLFQGIELSVTRK